MLMVRTLCVTYVFRVNVYNLLLYCYRQVCPVISVRCLYLYRHKRVCRV